MAEFAFEGTKYAVARDPDTKELHVTRSNGALVARFHPRKDGRRQSVRWDLEIGMNWPWSRKDELVKLAIKAATGRAVA